MSTTQEDVAAAASNTREQVEEASQYPSQADNPWPKRIEQWCKFAQKVHERGVKIETRYQDERDANQEGTLLNDIGGKKVNMFFSNVSVIKESLYNSLPKPVVTRLHKEEFDNDSSRVAATIMQRGLSYEIQHSPSFDTAVKAAILDRLVPGIGTLWISFRDTQKVPRSRGLPPRVVMESVNVEVVYWKDLMYEPRRAWEQCSWVGRRHQFDQRVATKRWGSMAVLDNSGGNGVKTVPDQLINSGKTEIIEMWDKNTRKQYWLNSDGYILQELDDPYDLMGFFPTPKPLIASPPTSKFLPLSDYYMAQDQYMVLDTLYGRINLIIQAVRVAGVYDASMPAIGRMLSGTENKLIPVDNWAMFAEKGGVKGTIDWFPVEVVSTVLQHLVSTFEFIKKQLFEVTGMADIVRGSTNQYETAQAQQIKARFASIRMNGYQRDVGVFVRDTLRIMGEMIAQLYTPEKLSKICGQLPLEDQQYVPAALQILRDDFVMNYSISIEADSLTQSDWSMEQQERMGYVQVLAQFLTSAVPAATEFPALAPMLVAMIKFASTAFKGATELEGILDKTLMALQQSGTGKEEQPSPEQIKAQIEQQKAESERLKMEQEMQIKREDAAMDMQMKREDMLLAKQKHDQEMQMAREKHAQEMEFAREKANLQAEVETAKAATKMVQDEEKFKQQQAHEAAKPKEE